MKKSRSELNYNEATSNKKCIDFDLQSLILTECSQNKLELSKFLREKKLAYDNLRYKHNNRPAVSDRYYKLSEFAKEPRSIPVISFFSGAGGLDLGFEAAGFQHILLTEINPLFCETVKFNRVSWNVEPADVSDEDSITQLISSRIGNIAKFEGVFIGGPPCQPFSIASNQRYNKNGDNFKRTGFAHKKNGNLLFDYIKLIKKFRPAAFLIENVPGLIDVDGGEQLEQAYRQLEACGYCLHDPLILKANHHYVPQQRTRLFVIGNRLKKAFHPPQPTNFSLPVGPVFDLSTEGVENHVTRHHSAESIMRYMMLDYGQRDQLGRVDRLDPKVASKTVIAGGTSGGGRSHLHPYIPRTISVRECARIQTFPDDYVFKGPVARQFTQVGNAVPPILGAQMAEAMYQSFFA